MRLLRDKTPRKDRMGANSGVPLPPREKCDWTSLVRIQSLLSSPNGIIGDPGTNTWIPTKTCTRMFPR